MLIMLTIFFNDSTQITTEFITTTHHHNTTDTKLTQNKLTKNIEQASRQEVRYIA